MRLDKHEVKKATSELLSILAQNPYGKATSDLRCTPFFHGGRTLSNRQIIRLLRSTGKVRESVGRGMRSASLWRLQSSASA